MLNSFYKLRKQYGLIFGFWTKKVIKEIEELILNEKLVESYDMEQLQATAGKDLREHCAKYGMTPRTVV